MTESTSHPDAIASRYRRVRIFRIFLSSPGDVADERSLARKVIAELSVEPFFKDNVILRIVSWDDPAGPVPMRSHLDPQANINIDRPKPSECEFVVVNLWSRMGTPLSGDYRSIDGRRYLSGTEWEYEDALKGAPNTEVFVYARTEKVLFDGDDPAVLDKLQQLKRAKAFLSKFRNSDGTLNGSFANYDTPSAFAERLKTDLRERIAFKLDQISRYSITGYDSEGDAWSGSPYPGLRSFAPSESEIFFGRDREIDALIAQLRRLTHRGLVVVGGSGLGKSSLIYAGLIPRLKNGALEGSQAWPVLSLTPGSGGNPFETLVAAFQRIVPISELHAPQTVTSLIEKPELLSTLIIKPVTEFFRSNFVLLFVDQLEEVFTAVSDAYRAPFIDLLGHAASSPYVHVIGTLRADFLPQAATSPVLAALLQENAFILGPPGSSALMDMIQRPAERAALQMEKGLVDEVLQEVGGDPWAPPLVAFTLEELYRRTGSDRQLTLETYRALGGLRGAISRYTAVLLNEIEEAEGKEAVERALPQIFLFLISLDAAGTVTRRRAVQENLVATPLLGRVVASLIRGRLLIAEGNGSLSTVTLTHETLITEWPTLREWVNRNRARLQRIEILLSSLSSSEVSDRRHAIDEIAKYSGAPTSSVVAAVINRFSDDDEEIRTTAIGVVAEFGALAVPALVEALGGSAEISRSGAIDALSIIARTSNLMPWLMDAVLHHPSSNIRRGVISFLGEYDEWSYSGEKSVYVPLDVIPALTTALRDQDKQNRAEAVASLERRGREALGILADALGSKTENMSQLAADALVRMALAQPYAGAINSLIYTLNDEQTTKRRKAVDALLRIGAPTAGPLARVLLDSPDQEFRHRLVRVLSQLGPNAADAGTALTMALDGRSFDAQIRAREALQMTKEITIPGIVETLQNPEPEVRKLAIAALAQIDARDASNAARELVVALGDTDKFVREGAKNLLRDIGTSAVPVLITAVLHSRRSGIRCECIKILGRIRPRRIKIRKCLEAASKESDQDVATAASEALIVVSSGPAQKPAPSRVRNAQR
jgi:HEAT repeat protein